MPSGRGVLDLVQKPRSSTQKHPPRFPNRLSWIDGRTVAVSRRSPGASGSGLGFSNGLKQAELENPAPDRLRGDYHGKNKIFIVVGERISFKPKAGKRGTLLSKKVTAKWTGVAPHSAAVESTSSSKMLPIRRLLQ